MHWKGFISAVVKALEAPQSKCQSVCKRTNCKHLWQWVYEKLWRGLVLSHFPCNLNISAGWGGQLKTGTANANSMSQSFGQLSSVLKHSQTRAPYSSALYSSLKRMVRDSHVLPISANKYHHPKSYDGSKMCYFLCHYLFSYLQHYTSNSLLLLNTNGCVWSVFMYVL